MIYMDYNATSLVRPEALEAMLPFYRESFGNASSIHKAGQRVKAAIEDAREKVARFLGCAPQEVVFTSGGSEADNTALKGAAAAWCEKGNHIITTRVEHPAVLNTCAALEKQGYEITWLDVNREGRLDLAQLEASITEHTILISVMAANNETGVIFPVNEIGEIAARRGVIFHCDAVQAAGRMEINCRKMNAGLLSVSGHKLGAPQGIGVLVVRSDIKIQPLIHGGAQERNRRAGTENVAGIVGLGKACELTLVDGKDFVCMLRDKLEKGIMASIPDTYINGDIQNRLPNTTNISFTGVAVDSLLANLDLAGVAASAGSACSSGTLRTSHVLSAMGIDAALVQSAVRFSLGYKNTATDVDAVLEILPDIVTRLRK
jgi:cysteine desulfurase